LAIGSWKSFGRDSEDDIVLDGQRWRLLTAQAPP